MPDMVSKMVINAETGGAEAGLEKVKRGAQGLQKEADRVSKGASSSFSKMSKTASGAFSQIAGSMNSIAPAASTAIGGFQSMATGATALNAALGPIGIIIAAIALVVKALSSYFKGSIDGAQKFAGIMGYLKGILAVVQDAFIELGRWIVWAFENPKEAVKQLWEAIKQNIVNRWEGLIQYFKSSFEFFSNGFKALGSLIKSVFNDEAKADAQKYFAAMKDSMIDVGKAAIQMTTGLDVDKVVEKGTAALAEMKRVAEANAKIERDLFQLRLDNLALSGRESNARREIASLSADVKNTEEVSLGDRIAALEKVKTLEFAIADEKVKNAQRAADLQAKQMELSTNSIEDEEKLQQLKNAVNNALIERDSKLKEIYAQEKELGNLVSTYGEEYINLTEREAKAAKAASDAKLKLEEQLASYKLERQKGTLEGDLAALKLQLDEKLMLEEEYQLRKADIEKKYRDKGVEDAKKAAADTAAATKAANAGELERLSRIAETTTNSYSERVEAYKSMLAQQLISQYEFDEAVKAMEQERNQQIADFSMQALDAVSMMYEAAKNRELAAAGDNAAKKEEIEKKYAKKQKKIAIVQALINGALGITKAFAQLGPIAGIIGAALIAASTAAQIAVISSQSFAQGGIVQGTSFSGDKTLVRANAGEMVLNKGQQGRLFRMLNNGIASGNRVVFEIAYDKLVGVLDNGAQLKTAY